MLLKHGRILSFKDLETPLNLSDEESSDVMFLKEVYMLQLFKL